MYFQTFLNLSFSQFSIFPEYVLTSTENEKDAPDIDAFFLFSVDLSTYSGKMENGEKLQKTLKSVNQDNTITFEKNCPSVK